MRLTYLENRHNIHDSPWTADLIERLKLLWAEGLSASQIADELAGKFTRMSVIGKVHRLKLPARKPRQPAQRKSYARRRANGIPKPPAPPPRPPRPPRPQPQPGAKMRQLTFAKLKPQHCRWPLGELLEPPRLFCAADTEGEVYCPFHQRIARPPNGRGSEKAPARYHYLGG
jgi:GcrA cell cycle regulator